MWLQKVIFSMHFLLVSISLLILLSTINAYEWADPLTEAELLEKYDGKLCSRECVAGDTRICYYKFTLSVYDTMGGLCTTCSSGNLTACYAPGCITGNGVPRSIVTINQQFPGPSIQVCKDDLIVVDLLNDINGADATIHWHGIHQKETPWMDGVPMVTQCPIAGGDKFRYKFWARQVGTHYYHGHSGVLRANGMFGTLNVRDPNDPNKSSYDIDSPKNDITIADWNNYLAETLIPGPRNGAFQAQSLLINGRGAYVDRTLQTVTFAPMTVFYVQKNKRTRFRIDNVGFQNCPMAFSINGYKLTVIASDGFSVEPVVVDVVVSGAGERYDVVFNAVPIDPTINEAIITVRAIDSCAAIQLQEFARIKFVDDINNFQSQIGDSAPFTYATRPAYTPVSGITLNNPHTDCKNPYGSYCIAALTQKQLEPAVGGDLRNAIVTSSQTLTFGFFVGTTRPSTYLSVGSNAMVGAINNFVSGPTPYPLLTQNDAKNDIPFCNATNVPSTCLPNTACYCVHMMEFKKDEIVELIFKSTAATNGTTNHPIHLHGNAFQVMNMGTNAQAAANTTAYQNAKHWPAVKDTVTLPSGGFVVVRFRAYNAGRWFIHCHFEYHMHIGMNAIIGIGNYKQWPKPPRNFPKCGHFSQSVYERDNYYKY